MTTPKPVVLCILDGWGLRPETEGNAVAQAATPNFDRMMRDCPNSTLTTFGPDVGLPMGQMGNSEVGHMNIGAGRVVEMDLARINGVIARGELADQPAVQRIIAAGTGVVHVCGVLSDGGVHSHIDHMIGMMDVLVAAGRRVALHLFTDGRDVAPKSTGQYLQMLLDRMPKDAFIATVSGRYYAMDRDNRWDRVSQAFGAIVHGDGIGAVSAAQVISANYANDTSDEFFLPSVIGDYAGMADGDVLVCLNFRADRAREILAAIAEPDFDGFETGPRPQLALVSGFTEYSKAHSEYCDVIFPEQDIVNTLGSWVAQKGLSQFRIAETEKYPHVTFFLNGGVEVPAAGEDRYLAPSPKVATYDMQPEMSSEEVTDNLVGAISSGTYDLIVVNYANPDMVGHTGDLEAAKAACASVDVGLGRVEAALNTAGGAMIVCADHGNCETMIDPETGGPHTAHTVNPVPVVLIGGPTGAKLRAGGRLADLAPSLLALMGLDLPKEMTGKSLIET
ncbi:2,3-bisphosphoglycerate-independent phosphoglycerate mutase [Amylibacter sp. IMCC11727]|uniref:2,3-bisphosphoglycerate-independent phosphoglycerate mutase n=1 Tax=Amylibacter sp. IMCC11727 TaxID=3039851 RepID=UPI00244DA39F|nr:2,3-bisphosphoglycerate-independent phosphoglycerate mutase [Amylibacter sp. IMCC11727]WGI21958.1 2,3-bisphosphoglycerate-independent phosphoglycerate mutase [Amylibacter sp. IMCC11727]